MMVESSPRLRLSLKSNGGSVDVPSARLIVLVGPNNSGKSRALFEIEKYLRGTVGTKVIDAAELVLPEDEAALRALLSSLGPFLSLGSWIIPSAGGGQLEITEAMVKNVRRHDLARRLAGAVVLDLDAKTRLELTEDQDAGDPRGVAKNHLAVLLKRPEVRAQLRTLVHRGLGKYLVLNPTHAPKLQLNLTDRAPRDEDEELSLSKRAVDFHDTGSPVKFEGGGYRAYIGILLAAIATNSVISLIDEPEAFLHPPLARRLGSDLATLAINDPKRHHVVATHSADFLMGCVDAGVEIAVVRLSYDGQVGRARVLDPGVLRKLVAQPLLRSARVLGGLFSKGVIVTEAAADTAFYSEINHRLVAARTGGEVDIHFISAYGKDNIPRIAGLLRGLGVPAAAIVDLDFVNEHEHFSSIIPSDDIDSIEALCVECRRAYGRQSLIPKEVGVDALRGHERQVVDKLIERLAAVGIFLVHQGQLEGWLPQADDPPRKSKWVPWIFERMGSEPSSPNYICPADGDVWGFMRSVTEWINDGDRRGMPR